MCQSSEPTKVGLMSGRPEQKNTTYSVRQLPGKQKDMENREMQTSESHHRLVELESLEKKLQDLNRCLR